MFEHMLLPIEPSESVACDLESAFFRGLEPPSASDFRGV